MAKKISVELTEREFATLDSALVKYHNSILDKRRKMRPSERAMWTAEVRRLRDRLLAEAESLKDD